MPDPEETAFECPESFETNFAKHLIEQIIRQKDFYTKEKPVLYEKKEKKTNNITNANRPFAHRNTITM